MLHIPTLHLLFLSPLQSNRADPSHKAFTISAADQFGRRLLVRRQDFSQAITSAYLKLEHG